MMTTAWILKVKVAQNRKRHDDAQNVCSALNISCTYGGCYLHPHHFPFQLRHLQWMEKKPRKHRFGQIGRVVHTASKPASRWNQRKPLSVWLHFGAPCFKRNHTYIILPKSIRSFAAQGDVYSYQTLAEIPDNPSVNPCSILFQRPTFDLSRFCTEKLWSRSHKPHVWPVKKRQIQIPL